MYLQNKYTRWYYSIVDRAKSRTFVEHKETHHIIPKCLGGKNSKENLVDLTGKEHFLCHLLLTKMVADNRKLVYAAWGMANLNNPLQQRYKVTGRIYEILRKEFQSKKSKDTRHNNPMHDPVIRKRHEESIRKRGKTIGNTGKKRGPISDQLRDILRQKTLESMTGERRAKIRQQQLNRTSEQKAKYKFAHSKRISCIFCQKQFAPGNFNRWHGDNCKHK
jgi:hypothetical protein